LYFGGLTQVVGQGPAFLFAVSPAILNLGSTIPAGGSITSALLQSDGCGHLAFACTSSQAGVASIVCYLDRQGLIPIKAALNPTSATLLANTPNGIDNGAASYPVFQSFQVQVTNTGIVPATLSAVLLLLQAV
jgi:hypothetical protein